MQWLCCEMAMDRGKHKRKWKKKKKRDKHWVYPFMKMEGLSVDSVSIKSAFWMCAHLSTHPLLFTYVSFIFVNIFILLQFPHGSNTINVNLILRYYSLLFVFTNARKKQHRLNFGNIVISSTIFFLLFFCFIVIITTFKKKSWEYEIGWKFLFTKERLGPFHFALHFKIKKKKQTVYFAFLWTI